LLAQRSAATADLPPALPWQGASKALVVAAGHPWITHAEAKDFRSTPSYQETRQYLERLCASTPSLHLRSLGCTLEGRDLMLVVAAEDAVNWQTGRRDKPVLLVQAGIHAGEIDGKDAGLMLLRDLANSEKGALLKQVTLLFIPILSPDGHERVSPYNRVNQRGPDRMGWRTNARNLNLNRDYAKLDTPEIRAVVALLAQAQPDLYLDLHVTDGCDTQYDITYGFVGSHGYSPNQAAWLDGVLRPRLDGALQTMGHVPFPYFFSAEDKDPKAGILDFTGSPRFSNSYGDAVHIATLLVENHSLKPYAQRVLGTYVLLEACLRLLAEHGTDLRQAALKDQALRPEELPLSWTFPKEPGPLVDYLGIAFTRQNDQALGFSWIEYLGQRESWKLPFTRQNQAAATVRPAKAYWVPAAWPEVIERLSLHGLAMEQLSEPRELELHFARFTSFEFAKRPNEGHFTVRTKHSREKRKQTFPAGSVRVATDQVRGELASLLLEPDSPDSFLQWGFFHSVFQATEYIESYLMGPLAKKMMADPKLAAEFQQAVEAGALPDEASRMEWFYRRSVYADEQYLLYPVGFED
jgi:hypothetical protein